MPLPSTNPGNVEGTSAPLPCPAVSASPPRAPPPPSPRLTLVPVSLPGRRCYAALGSGSGFPPAAPGHGKSPGSPPAGGQGKGPARPSAAGRRETSAGNGDTALKHLRVWIIGTPYPHRYPYYPVSSWANRNPQPTREHATVLPTYLHYCVRCTFLTAPPAEAIAPSRRRVVVVRIRAVLASDVMASSPLSIVLLEMYLVLGLVELIEVLLPSFRHSA